MSKTEKAGHFEPRYCAPPVNYREFISLKNTQQDLVKALLTLRDLHAENRDELILIDDALASANVYPWKSS